MSKPIAASLLASIRLRTEQTEIYAEDPHAEHDRKALLAEVDRLREKGRNSLAWEGRMAGALHNAVDSTHNLATEINRLGADLAAATKAILNAEFQLSCSDSGAAWEALGDYHQTHNQDAYSDLVYSPEPDSEGFRRAAVIPISGRSGEVVASTIVDPDLYPALSRWRWNLSANGYAVRTREFRGQKETLKLHRVVMCCVLGDDLIIDHINREKLDNRRANLRFATHLENSQNREKTVYPKGSLVSLDAVCRHGHPRTPENTHHEADGKRRCKICRRLGEARRTALSRGGNGG